MFFFIKFQNEKMVINVIVNDNGKIIRRIFVSKNTKEHKNNGKEHKNLFSVITFFKYSNSGLLQRLVFETRISKTKATKKPGFGRLKKSLNGSTLSFFLFQKLGSTVREYLPIFDHTFFPLIFAAITLDILLNVRSEYSVRSK